MSQFIVIHKYIKSLEEVAAAFTDEAMAQYAQAMASGLTSAKCVKTWDPIQYGQPEPMICLWEADSSEDIIASLNQFGMLDYISADIMQVDETDWAQVAAMTAS